MTQADREREILILLARRVPEAATVELDRLVVAARGFVVESQIPEEVVLASGVAAPVLTGRGHGVPRAEPATRVGPTVDPDVGRRRGRAERCHPRVRAFQPP